MPPKHDVAFAIQERRAIWTFLLWSSGPIGRQDGSVPPPKARPKNIRLLAAIQACALATEGYTSALGSEDFSEPRAKYPQSIPKEKSHPEGGCK